jgi:hypothetical protein
MLGTSSSYVASTLSEDFQVICCNLHAQHPRWLFRCKYQQVNKVKGQLGSPQKTMPPSGATRGASPPEKMVPFFSQKFASSPTTLNLSFGQFQIERGQPSGKDARVGNSLRLQQDTTLLPCLWTSGPLVKSKLSTSDFPKSRKEQRNGMTSEIESFTYIYRNVSSK